MPPKNGYGLKDSPFFRLSNRKKLSRLLRVSAGALSDLLAQTDLYTRKWKHKKEKDKWSDDPPSGAEKNLYRPIDIPCPSLKKIQGRISVLLSRISAPNFLFGSVKNRSYVDNAACHVNGTAFWLLDIENYFPSCKANNVARFFSKDLQCSEDVVAILVALTTHQGCLPQGSPCSPILAYYSYRHMWLEIESVVIAAGCRLSLYADDITISGEVVRKEIIWKIKKIIHRNRMRIKSDKELSLIRSPADITGVIVKNGRTFLPNRQLERLSKIRKEMNEARDEVHKHKLSIQLQGRLAQRRQVEGPKNSGYL